MSDQVRPKDVVEGGIAVRTVGQKIAICPYLFRQICRNGAVMPQVAKPQQIERVDFDAPAETLEAINEQLREAVRLLCDRGVRPRHPAGQIGHVQGSSW